MTSTRFQSLPVSGDEQARRIQFIRNAFERLEEEVGLEVYTCRETSTAITKLEEACMWFIKGVTHG